MAVQASRYILQEGKAACLYYVQNLTSWHVPGTHSTAEGGGLFFHAYFAAHLITQTPEHS